MIIEPTCLELKKQIAELQQQNEILLQTINKESYDEGNHYQLLFENSLDGFAYCKVIFENEIPSDFIYLKVNPAFEKLTGYKDVLGKRVTEVVPDIKEKNHDLLQLFGSVALSGEPAKCEIYFEPLKTWFEISVICPEKGFFIEIFDDISERINATQLIKQKNDELIAAREQAEENEKKFRSFFEDDLTGDFIMKENGVLLDCNSSFLEIFGYENKHEIIGKSITLLYKDVLEFDFIKSELKKGRIIKDYETIRKRKNGDLIDIIENKTAIYDSNGEIIEIKGYVYDITERKKVEKALKEREELLDTITNNVDALIAIVNKDFEYVFINNKAEEYFARTKNEIIGKRSIEIIGSEAFERGRPNVIRALNGESVTYENQFPDKNEVIQFTQNSVVPYFQNNEITGAIILNVNVSQLKLAELEILQKNLELEKLNLDKDRFISILAHDLKSPLSGILGLTDLLIENFKEFDSETIERQLSLLQNSANRTYNLLNDLLGWAIAKSSKQIFIPTRLNLFDICEEVMMVAQVQANLKNIQTTNSVKKESMVFGDAVMLKTIIRDLVLNAIKFTCEKGSIDIYASQFNNEIVITIKDTGVGISNERLQNIFEIGEVNSTLGTRGEKGTGLGLLLCKEFVERHGGKIWVESEIGIGSRFKFTMPLKDENYDI